jgi:hypothetical protein
MTATPLRENGIAAALPRPSWNQLALALFVVAAILVVLTFGDYGVTWDEDVHNWYGVFVLDYYLSAFKDVRSLNWLNLYNYGAAFDMIAAAINRISPFGTYETRHLLNGLVGVLGAIGTWKLGRSLGGPRAGFLAALFLLLTPNYYGQMFNNPKDIPFAVGIVWATYYLVRLVPELPRPHWSLVVKFGVCTGLALGVRSGGLLLFCYLGLLLTLDVLWRTVETRSPRTFAAASWAGFHRVLLPAVLVAYPVMLLFWPWAQQAPIEHPLKSLLFFSHETFPFRTLFAGQYFPATDLPWAYLPVHILLALPELVLLLLLAAAALGIAHLWRRRGALDRSAVLTRFVLGFGVVFPVAYAVAIKAVLFDGMRHFIFVLPLIAVIAALAADRAIALLERLPYRRYAYAVLALYGIGHVGIMAMLHPDEYVYYNGFIGGVEGAAGLFKLDYWGNSYAEAVQGLEEYLRAEYGSDFMDHDFTVAVCGPPISAAWYFPPNFIFTPRHEQADFFIAFTKDDCHKSLPGKPIYRVERLGTLLSVVLDRRGLATPMLGAGW